MSGTRQANKQKRRDRILDEARKVLAERGYDALNTRDLAKAAGVTVPTLYNLIGNKAAILNALSLEGVAEVEAALSSIDFANALEFIEAIVSVTADYVMDEESYVRSALVAADLNAGSEELLEGYKLMAQRSAAVAEKGCIMARHQGLLIGNVPTRELAAQMYSGFYKPWREWAYGLITMDAFKHEALRGFYMCLSSDATPEFLEVLRGKLETLLHNETAQVG